MGDASTEMMPIMDIGDYRSGDRVRNLRQAGLSVVVIAIPMSLLDPHEAQAQRNHSQSLRRLAERGGLSSCEAMAILEDRSWRRLPQAEAQAALLAAMKGRASIQPTASVVERVVQEVEVKPLEWEEPCREHNWCWVAKSILGTYSVANDDGWHADLEDGRAWEWEPEDHPRSYFGTSAAKEACQAHFDRTIRAALTETGHG
jgi:transcriptional regulator with XRE-family HTH domain